jgi:hypothetical protein
MTHASAADLTICHPSYSALLVGQPLCPAYRSSKLDNLPPLTMMPARPKSKCGNICVLGWDGMAIARYWSTLAVGQHNRERRFGGRAAWRAISCALLWASGSGAVRVEEEIRPDIPAHKQ